MVDNETKMLLKLEEITDLLKEIRDLLKTGDSPSTKVVMPRSPSEVAIAQKEGAGLSAAQEKGRNQCPACQSLSFSKD